MTGTTPARALLDAWRERGADRLDPTRFRLLDALERRSASHGGKARSLLDARLSELMTQYATAIERAAGEAAQAHGADGTARSTAARGALGILVDNLAGRAQTGDGAPVTPLAPELLDYFRKTWSQVRTGQQLREALVQVPQNAGPLNSNSLVHRSLSLMRELSPGYLQHFLSYADALSWLEQLNAGDVPASKEVPRAAGAKKSTRAKAR